MSKEPPLSRLVGEPQWDPLRERRVYARILEAKEATKKRRKQLRWVAVGAMACGVLIVATVALLSVTQRSAPGRQPAVIAEKPLPREIEAPLPSLSLADGSRIFPSAGAKVQVEHQDRHSIRLVQRHGTVRYDVRPDRARNFQVRIYDLKVRVVGTVFTISATNESVAVAVQRGRVEVDRDGRTFPLGADEQIRLPRKREPEAPKPSSKRRIRPKKRALALDIETLLEQVDRARQTGDLDQAATLLQRALRTRKIGSRKSSLLFTLAKVEHQRGRFTAAAKTFARCFGHAPSGPLAEDALAREALAYKAAGKRAKAQQAARRYVNLYPQGLHLERLRTLLR